MNYIMIINADDEEQLDTIGSLAAYQAIKVCFNGPQIVNNLREYGWPSTIFISDDLATRSIALTTLTSLEVDDLATDCSQYVVISPLDILGKNSGLPNVWARPSQSFVRMTRSIVSHRVGNVVARVHKTDIANITNTITAAARCLIDLQFMMVRSGVDDYGIAIIDCVSFDKAAAAFITIGVDQQKVVEVQQALDYVRALKFFAKTDIMYAALAEHFAEISRPQITDQWATVVASYKTIYCRPYSNFDITHLFIRPGFFL